MNAKETDYRPNRLECSKAAVERFLREYFDQNPISQVTLCKNLLYQFVIDKFINKYFLLPPGVIGSYP